MKLPVLPSPSKIGKLSPSLYEALRHCYARALWLVFGEKNTLPVNSAALLGICFHKVVAAAPSGVMSREPDLAENTRGLFDNEAEILFRQNLLWLQNRFNQKEQLPFYYIQRERAVVVVEKMLSHRYENYDAFSTNTKTKDKSQFYVVERYLQSKDKLITGIIDLIDIKKQQIIDYKSSFQSLDKGREISDSEKRQLIIYAYLAKENGFEVKTGAIVRSNGNKTYLEFSLSEIENQADLVRKALKDYNNFISNKTDFQQLAKASIDGCRFCPCLPMCDVFWQQATLDWSNVVGYHVQGQIVSVIGAEQNKNFAILRLKIISGTIAHEGEVNIEQVPSSWIYKQGQQTISKGSKVRILFLSPPNPASRNLRIDKYNSWIWLLG